MGNSTFISLVHNASLLLALAVLFDLFAVRWRSGKINLMQVPVGVIVGLVGMAVMLSPWVYVPGIIFDTRSVLLGISGLFFGAVPTLIAILMTAAFRLSQGGAAAWTGVFVICATGGIGVLWRALRRSPLINLRPFELYTFGLLIHVVMLALMFTLPFDTAMRVLSNITLPVLVIYPVGTVLLGSLLVNRLRREQTLDALHESQTELLLAKYQIEHSRDSIFLIGPDGMILQVNQAACNALGYTREDLLKMKVGDVDKDFREDAWAGHWLELKQKKALRFETTHTNSSGALIPVELSLSYIEYEGREYNLALARDISERKQAEMALSERETRSRTTLYSIGDGVITTDTSGNILQMNPAASELTGWQETQAVGKPTGEVLQLIDRKTRTPDENPVQRVLETSKTTHLSAHTTLVSRDGWERPVAFICTLIQDEAHAALGVVLVIRDQTQDEEITRKLQLSEERYALANRELTYQLEELRRWQAVTIGRETRNIELKAEVNELLARAGLPPRYPDMANSQEFP